MVSKLVVAGSYYHEQGWWSMVLDVLSPFHLSISFIVYTTSVPDSDSESGLYQAIPQDLAPPNSSLYHSHPPYLLSVRLLLVTRVLITAVTGGHASLMLGALNLTRTE